MCADILGKISFAEFGIMRDYPFLIGLQLGFDVGKYKICDGGKHTVNISQECKWDNEQERLMTIVEKIELVNSVLQDAKCSYVSELKGKPVVVTVENNNFKSFRILTEVL